jgi:hypothetical protein
MAGFKGLKSKCNGTTAIGEQLLSPWESLNQMTTPGERNLPQAHKEKPGGNRLAALARKSGSVVRAGAWVRFSPEGTPSGYWLNAAKSIERRFFRNETTMGNSYLAVPPPG